MTETDLTYEIMLIIALTKNIPLTIDSIELLDAFGNKIIIAWNLDISKASYLLESFPTFGRPNFHEWTNISIASG